MSKNREQEIAIAMTNAVNCIFDARKVAECLTREHKTLQQGFTRVCVEWLRALSEVSYYDGRNEASVELAKSLLSIPEVKTLLDESFLPLV